MSKFNRWRCCKCGTHFSTVVSFEFHKCDPEPGTWSKSSLDQADPKKNINPTPQQKGDER